MMSGDFEVGFWRSFFALPYIFHLRQVTAWPFQRDCVMLEVLDVQDEHL